MGCIGGVLHVVGDCGWGVLVVFYMWWVTVGVGGVYWWCFIPGLPVRSPEEESVDRIIVTNRMTEVFVKYTQVV